MLAVRLLPALALTTALAVAASGASAGGSSSRCEPRGTPTCDPQGHPVQPGGGAAATPARPGRAGAKPTGAATRIAAERAIVGLGGGLPSAGAEGAALDPATGLAYVAVNGTIISGCRGDLTGTGRQQPHLAGAARLSVVDLQARTERASVATAAAPVWPEVDTARGVVYVGGSGDGTVAIHRLGTG